MELDVLAILVSLVAVGVSLYVARRPASVVEVEKEPEPEDERSLPKNPGGCTVNNHVWRKRPYLINNHEAVYACKNNCGSTLRHRFE